jgi:hypothetical protein
MQYKKLLLSTLVTAACAAPHAARADENLFGYVKGAEPLPKGALELYQSFTQRSDKGIGSYRALDSRTELEYGLTDKLAGGVELLAQSIKTRGILINAYIPKDEEYSLKPSGLEGYLKYNFLSPAKDPVGLSTITSFTYSWLDTHSGQDKNTYSFEQKLLLQKYFLDGQLIAAGNLGIEATRAHRKPIADLPADFEWPTEPEMEIELSAGGGLTYRFAPNWFIGAEALYEREHETEVDLERWSWFAGPTLHYGGQKWWATLTWMQQIKGGGERYDNQSDYELHLIEKTKREIRLKVGYNF